MQVSPFESLSGTVKYIAAFAYISLRLWWVQIWKKLPTFKEKMTLDLHTCVACSLKFGSSKEITMSENLCTNVVQCIPTQGYIYMFKILKPIFSKQFWMETPQLFFEVKIYQHISVLICDIQLIWFGFKTFNSRITLHGLYHLRRFWKMKLHHRKTKLSMSQHQSCSSFIFFCSLNHECNKTFHNENK